RCRRRRFAPSSRTTSRDGPRWSTWSGWRSCARDSSVRGGPLPASPLLARPRRSGTSAAAMKHSISRILTTHVGSLVRPQELQDFLRAQQSGKSYDPAAHEKCLTHSVAEVVRRQAEAGIDVVSDGEFGKSISWSQYVLERLSGFERRPIKPGANPFARGADRTRFAE